MMENAGDVELESTRSSTLTVLSKLFQSHSFEMQSNNSSNGRKESVVVDEEKDSSDVRFSERQVEEPHNVNNLSLNRSDTLESLKQHINTRNQSTSGKLSPRQDLHIDTTRLLPDTFVDMTNGLNTSSDDGMDYHAGDILFLRGKIIESPIFSMIANKNIDALQKLLEQNPDHVQCVTIHKQSALHLAVKQDNRECIKILLDKGSYIEAMDSLGFTPLHLAAKLGLSEVILLMFDHGAIVNTFNFARDSALHTAIKFHHWKTAKILIKVMLVDKKSLDEVNRDGLSYLHLACINDDEQIMDLLLQSGASKNLLDGQGNTCLHITAMKGNVRVVKLLIKYNVDLEALNWNNATALILAMQCLRADVAEVLMRSNATLDIQENWTDDLFYQWARRINANTSLIDQNNEIGQEFWNTTSPPPPMSTRSNGLFSPIAALTTMNRFTTPNSTLAQHVEKLVVDMFKRLLYVQQKYELGGWLIHRLAFFTVTDVPLLLKLVIADHPCDHDHDNDGYAWSSLVKGSFRKDEISIDSKCHIALQALKQIMLQHSSNEVILRMIIPILPYCDQTIFQLITKEILFLGRYFIPSSNFIKRISSNQSRCFVRAYDLLASSSREQTLDVLNAMDPYVEVEICFMSLYHEYQREIDVRKLVNKSLNSLAKTSLEMDESKLDVSVNEDEDNNYILPLHRSHKIRDIVQSMSTYLIQHPTLVTYKYCIVTPKPDKTLQDFVQSEQFSLSRVREMLLQVGTGIHQLHELDLIHGDLCNLFNIVIRGNKCYLSGFYACVSIHDNDSSLGEIESTSTSPELVWFCNYGDKELLHHKDVYRQYWKEFESESHNLLEFTSTSTQWYVLKQFHYTAQKERSYKPVSFGSSGESIEDSLDDVNMKLLPYNLIAPSFVFDIWCFGQLSFFVITHGKQLFECNMNGLLFPNDLPRLYHWNEDKDLISKLQSISHLHISEIESHRQAYLFLFMLLRAKPLNRPKHIFPSVLEHEFLQPREDEFEHVLEEVESEISDSDRQVDVEDEIHDQHILKAENICRQQCLIS